MYIQNAFSSPVFLECLFCSALHQVLHIQKHVYVRVRACARACKDMCLQRLDSIETHRSCIGEKDIAISGWVLWDARSCISVL